MKKLILISLFLTTSALAGQFTGDTTTTCQLLQDGKVIKKATCTYGGYINEQDMSLSYGFKIKGYPKEIDTYVIRDPDGKNGEMNFHYEMNGKSATPLRRDIKTLQIVKDVGERKDLSCMKQTKTKFEICVPSKSVDLTAP